MQLTPAARQAQLTWLPHPLAVDGRSLHRAVVLDGETLPDYARRMGIVLAGPLAVTVNGAPVADWRALVIRQGDLIVVQRAVQGGGGSNPLRIIAMIAVAVVAAYTGGLAASAFGSFIGQATTAAVMIGGSMLVNALLPPPNPMANGNKWGQSASPTYSLQGWQNRSRPYEPMPVVLGTHRMAPDLAGKPFTRFEDDNNQYLYQAFHFGLQPDLELRDLKLADTPLASYQEVELHWSDAQGVLPPQFDDVDTVAGGEAKKGVEIIRSSAPRTRRLEVDIAFSAYRVEDDGGVTGQKVAFSLQIRDAGTTNWRLWNEQRPTWEFTGDKLNTGRTTLSLDLPAGQYDVRLVKTSDDPVNDTRRQNALSWVQLKSFQESSADYSGQKRLGIRVKATGQLQGGLAELNAIAVARCPVWDGYTWAMGETRNPAWWFLWFARGRRDAVGRRLFGAGYADGRIDLEAIKQWGLWCQARQLQTSLVLDRSRTIGDVLDSLARCGRASRTFQSGRLGVVWDEADLPAVTVFGPANLRAGSFKVDWVTEELADEVVVTFINPDKGYKADQARALAPGVDIPRQTVTVDLDGCVNADQAGREANLIAAEQVLHRRRVTWETDAEGLVVRRGQVVLMSHDLTQWGASGRLLGGSRSQLRLDQPVTLDGSGYLQIRYPDGRMQLATVTGAGTTDVVTLASPLPVADAEGALPMPDDTPGANALDWLWFFNPERTPGRALRITGVEPLDAEHIRFTARDEIPDYYDAEHNPYVVIPPGQMPAVANVLGISVAESRINAVTGETELTLSWALTQNVRVWVRASVGGAILLDTVTSAASLPVRAWAGNTVRIEVAPVPEFGVLGGNGQMLDYNIGPIDVTPITNLHLVAPFIHTLALAWDAAPYAVLYRVQLWGGESLHLLRSIDTASPTFSYRLEDLVADGGPFRTLVARVYGLASDGRISAYAELVVSNPAPAVPDVRTGYAALTLAVSLTPQAEDTDVTGYRIWLSHERDTPPGAQTLAYDGPAPSVLLALVEGAAFRVGETVWVRAAAYDGFGKSNLNVSYPIGVVVTPLSADILALNEIGPEHLTPELAEAISNIDVVMGLDLDPLRDAAAELQQAQRERAQLAVAQAYALLAQDQDWEQRRQIGTAVAGIRRDVEVVVDELSAEVQERVTLAAQVDGQAAALVAERQVRADGDSALAQQLTTLDGRVGDNTARITDVLALTVAPTTALAQRLTTLDAKAGAAQATANDILNLGAGTNGTAFASKISSLEATNGQQSSQIGTLQQSVAGLGSRWAVTITDAGSFGKKVSGISLASDGSGATSFDVLANVFRVSMPDGSGSKPVFSVGAINGINAVGISGNLLVDGTIGANALSVQAMDATLARIDTLIGKTIRNQSGTNYINMAAFTGQWLVNFNNKVRIDPAGNAFFDGVVISRPTVVATGEIAVDITNTYIDGTGPNDPGGWTNPAHAFDYWIDTGVNDPLIWSLSASSPSWTARVFVTEMNSYTPNAPAGNVARRTRVDASVTLNSTFYVEVAGTNIDHGRVWIHCTINVLDNHVKTRNYTIRKLAWALFQVT
ncbi:host specificity factor TipJ family phage tail protein [Chitiniphilus shinanonensis]|uniref:host specificity factor TipJ family phage tail protein n=1 Tax=Chitiniphilus shinanonensis TaxID=553088 RepID=UPI003041A872